MRQITTDAYNAFKNNKRFKRSNTEVVVNGNEVVIELFGNKIVKKINDEIFISNGGWNSVTTKERLYPFVRRIRKNKDSLIINEKVVLENKKWYHLTELQ
jgi:CO dehydrogenase nickel-insertion accessory protein CooC1